MPSPSSSNILSFYFKEFCSPELESSILEKVKKQEEAEKKKRDKEEAEKAYGRVTEYNILHHHASITRKLYKRIKDGDFPNIEIEKEILTIGKENPSHVWLRIRDRATGDRELRLVAVVEKYGSTYGLTNLDPPKNDDDKEEEDDDARELMVQQTRVEYAIRRNVMDQFMEEMHQEAEDARIYGKLGRLALMSREDSIAEIERRVKETMDKIYNPRNNTFTGNVLPPPGTIYAEERNDQSMDYTVAGGWIYGEINSPNRLDRKSITQEIDPETGNMRFRDIHGNTFSFKSDVGAPIKPIEDPLSRPYLYDDPAIQEPVVKQIAHTLRKYGNQLHLCKNLPDMRTVEKHKSKWWRRWLLLRRFHLGDIAKSLIAVGIVTIISIQGILLTLGVDSIVLFVGGIGVFILMSMHGLLGIKDATTTTATTARSARLNNTLSEKA